MATMKNHTFGFNIENTDHREADKWCDQLKKKQELSKYIRELILADLKKKRPAPTQGAGIKIDLTLKTPPL